MKAHSLLTDPHYIYHRNHGAVPHQAGSETLPSRSDVSDLGLMGTQSLLEDHLPSHVRDCHLLEPGHLCSQPSSLWLPPSLLGISVHRDNRDQQGQTPEVFLPTIQQPPYYLLRL